MKDYKEILEGVVNIINTTEKSDIGFANICVYIYENCPKLKESEDERIRKRIYNYINVTLDDNESEEKEKWLAWIEKQSEKEQDPCEHCNENFLIAITFLVLKREHLNKVNQQLKRQRKKRLIMPIRLSRSLRLGIGLFLMVSPFILRKSLKAITEQYPKVV